MIFYGQQDFNKYLDLLGILLEKFSRKYRRSVNTELSVWTIKTEQKEVDKKMLEFFIYNIFVHVGGQVFQQSAGIPMGTNCAPLLEDQSLYSFETEFIQ
jgi:hypothetical protein